MAYCQYCGSQLCQGLAVCANCGRRLAVVQSSPNLGDSTMVRFALPIGCTPLSIIAGYLGLFSLTLILAPVSMIVGILAIRDIKAHPGKHGLGRAWFGVIMGGVFSILAVVLLLVGLFSI